MTIQKILNKKIEGSESKHITADFYWLDNQLKKPIVIFIHGFKGFKDWGHWHLIAEYFAQHNFCFIKFNFTHNGVTPENLTEFCDLEAFGNNNFSKELYDLNCLIDFVKKDEIIRNTINADLKNINLIGHSRGGPISIITALERPEINKIVTLASVHELNYSWIKNPEMIDAWKKKGVHFILNGRTKQQMPLKYQLYQDYELNLERFNIQKTLQKLHKEILIIHGSNDPAVPLKAAEYLEQHALNSQKLIIEDANHVFGGTHPHPGLIPKHSLKLCNKAIHFLS